MRDPNKLLDIASQTLISMIDAVKSGGQWLAGQVPDVLHQLILWTIAIGVINLLGLIALFVANVWVWKKIIAIIVKDDDYIPMAILAAPVNVAMLLLYGKMLCNVFDGLKAVIAPKLFLLQYAAELYRATKG